MAAKEMYDYLTTDTADYTTVEIDIPLQRSAKEKSKKDQTILKKDTGSPAVVSSSDLYYYECVIEWPNISESDAGTIFDIWNDISKCNYAQRTFYLHFPDGHIYVARWMGEVERIYTPNLHAAGRRGIAPVQVRIEAKK